MCSVHTWGRGGGAQGAGRTCPTSPRLKPLRTKELPMPPPGTLEERGPRGFRGGRRRPRRSQRRSHCGPLWLGEAEEEPGLATAPSWKGVLGRGTALRRWEAGPRMGGGRRAARGSAGGERWALLLGSPSCSAQTSSSLLPLLTLSQSSCAASFGKPPLVSLTEAALLLRPVALTSAEMRVFVGSYVSPRPHSHSHTHTRL